MTQASVKPPTFILFVNEPELIHFSYMRFLENRLRESFGFEGTPIRLVLRGKKRDDEDLMDIMIIVYAVLAYLIGSIPSGLIIGKLFSIQTYGNMALKILALLIHIELSVLKAAFTSIFM